MPSAGNILVVDDDPPTLAFIAEALSDEGYTVRATADEAGARALIAERQPDLILADLHLGGSETSVLARHYTCMAQVGVPVVVMTTDPRAAEALPADGIVYCLMKPFDLDELAECVARYIRRDRTAAF